MPAPQASAETWASMITGMQKGTLSTRLGIPIIHGINDVHGHNNEATIFPHNIGLGATRYPELIKRIGDAAALEVRATGIPYVFAPCIAVCRDPRWGRCYESYSEDPTVVQNMTALISGLQGEAPENSLGRPYVAGSLGLVDEETIPKYELTVEDKRLLAKEYSRVLMWRHRARQTAVYSSEAQKGVHCCTPREVASCCYGT